MQHDNNQNRTSLNNMWQNSRLEIIISITTSLLNIRKLWCCPVINSSLDIFSCRSCRSALNHWSSSLLLLSLTLMMIQLLPSALWSVWEVVPRSSSSLYPLSGDRFCSWGDLWFGNERNSKVHPCQVLPWWLMDSSSYLQH